MTRFADLLAGGDLRSIGEANRAAALVLDDPALVEELFGELRSDDPRVRMRSADALEKIGSDRPEILQPLKNRLILEMRRAAQQEVKWHLAQMMGCLRLTKQDRARVTPILFEWLDDPSRIVQVSSLDTLARLAAADDVLRRRVRKTIEMFQREGSPALKARCRKLAKMLNPLPATAPRVSRSRARRRT